MRAGTGRRAVVAVTRIALGAVVWLAGTAGGPGAAAPGSAAPSAASTPPAASSPSAPVAPPAAAVPRGPGASGPPGAQEHPAGAPLLLGPRALFEIRAPEGTVPPAERAARALQALRLALDDLDCGPERLEVDDVAGQVEILLCGRRVIAVHAEDAAWEGSTVEATAARWTEALRAGFADAKAERYGSILLRGAILGLLIPIAFLLAMALVRAGSRRLQAALMRRVPEGGVRLGPLRLLASEGERRFVYGLVGLLRILVTLVLAYSLAVVLFRQLPWTRDLAAAMLRPFAGLAREAGPGLATLLPRLAALAILIAVLRLAARAVDRLVLQVRQGQVRLEPLLSPDNVFAAGLTARLALVVTGILAAALLIPGSAGRVLLAVLALAGLALVLGARDAAANLLAGLVVLYGRPFRTGQAVRLAGREGRVEHKGLLQIRLRERDGDLAIVPNSAALGGVVVVEGEPEALEGVLVLESARGVEVAGGLLRHAAAEAGLRREDGTVRLEALADGAFEFRISWPLPPGADPPEVRDRYLRALAAHAAGLQVAVRSARLGGAAGPGGGAVPAGLPGGAGDLTRP